MRVRVGPPVELKGRSAAADTRRIMAAITHLVEEVRGAKAPADRFDMKKQGVRQIGNPKKASRKDKE